MMTPKEKAIERVNKYKNAPFNCKDCDMPYCDIPCTQLNISEAKQCALIEVDEILENFGTLTEGKQHYAAYCTIKFYEEVKKEIELL
jgi:hypothetical protein